MEYFIVFILVAIIIALIIAMAKALLPSTNRDKEFQDSLLRNAFTTGYRDGLKDSLQNNKVDVEASYQAYLMHIKTILKNK